MVIVFSLDVNSPGVGDPVDALPEGLVAVFAAQIFGTAIMAGGEPLGTALTGRHIPDRGRKALIIIRHILPPL